MLSKEKILSLYTSKCACGCDKSPTPGKTFVLGHNKGASTIPNDAIISDDEKWCAWCKTVKPKSEFGPHKRNKDGLAGHCRTCKSEQAKQYYHNNREERLEYVKEYAQKNPEKVAEAHRTKVKKNPEKYRALSRKTQQTRKARLLDAFDEYVDPTVVYRRDKATCGICGGHVTWEDYEMDHIVPLVSGGRHSYENVQVSHMLCNRYKGTSPLVELDI